MMNYFDDGTEIGDYAMDMEDYNEMNEYSGSEYG